MEHGSEAKQRMTSDLGSVSAAMILEPWFMSRLHSKMRGFAESKRSAFFDSVSGYRQLPLQLKLYKICRVTIPRKAIIFKLVLRRVANAAALFQSFLVK